MFAINRKFILQLMLGVGLEKVYVTIHYITLHYVRLGYVTLCSARAVQLNSRIDRSMWDRLSTTTRCLSVEIIIIKAPQNKNETIDRIRPKTDQVSENRNLPIIMAIIITSITRSLVEYG